MEKKGRRKITWKGKLKLKWKLFTIICHFHSVHFSYKRIYWRRIIFFSFQMIQWLKFSKVFLFSLLLKYSIFFLIWSIYRTNKMRKAKFVFSFKWFLFTWSYVHRINADGSPKNTHEKIKQIFFAAFLPLSLSLPLVVKKETRRDPK